MKTSASTRKVAAMVHRLERWFEKNQRPLPWRNRYDPYQIWVSEVMLQQTRMEVVLPYFERFLQRFPDVQSLAKASEPEVLSVWSGMGYYRRAGMLLSGARFVMDQYGGRIPGSPEDLRAVPGIGRYTAGAIASIAFNRRAPIVDGNVARVLARIDAAKHPAGSARFQEHVWAFAEELVERADSPRRLNQALMEAGALICRPRNPLCERCPVASMCRAHSLGKQEGFPRKSGSGRITALEIPLYLVVDRRGKLLMRREEGALMSGMFHLPHGNGHLLRSSHSAFKPLDFLGSFRHTITHRRIRFDVWKASTSSRQGFVWIDPRRLSEVPHPSYVRKAVGFL